MELSLEIAGDQIAGARDYQEDAFLTTYLDDESGESKSSALIVVADGMGGHAAGNIASNLVVSTFNKTFTGKFGKQDAPGVLREALKNANGGLKESIEETPGLDGMGCTMVTAAVTKGKIYWISVGDSHLYLIRDREITKKNEDHSYGGYLDRMRSQGIDVEAEAGLSRNMLMSAMTGEEIAEVDCPNSGYQLLPGDRVIIASDGLDTLENETILKTSAWSQTPKECVAGLLKAVEEAKRPRQDNTTIVVVDVVERAGADMRPPPSAPAVEVAPAKVELARERDLPASKERKGGSAGLIIGLILLLAIGAGGGYVYMTGMWRNWMPSEQARTPRSRRSRRSRKSPSPAAEAAGARSRERARAPETAGARSREAARAGARAPEAGPARAAGGRAPVPGRPEVRRQGTGDGGDPGRQLRDGQPESFRGGDRATPAHGGHAGLRHEPLRGHLRRVREVRPRDRAQGAEELRGRSEDPSGCLRELDDALAYTKWLSAQTGKKYRLPTEAQWEFAAMGGTTTRYWWGRELGSGRAHCFNCDTGLNTRSPTNVGRFPANLFGLHDTAGNVSEWVRDCWHPNYQDAPTDGSVWEGGDCSHRVARGGSFLNTGKSIRAKKRTKWKSQKGYDSVGFRVVRER